MYLVYLHVCLFVNAISLSHAQLLGGYVHPFVRANLYTCMHADTYIHTYIHNEQHAEDFVVAAAVTVSFDSCFAATFRCHVCIAYDGSDFHAKHECLLLTSVAYTFL